MDKRTLIAISLVVIVAVAGVACFFFMSSQSSEDNSSGNDDNPNPQKPTVKDDDSIIPSVEELAPKWDDKKKSDYSLIDSDNGFKKGFTFKLEGEDEVEYIMMLIEVTDVNGSKVDVTSYMREDTVAHGDYSEFGDFLPGMNIIDYTDDSNIGTIAKKNGNQYTLNYSAKRPGNYYDDNGVAHPYTKHITYQDLVIEYDSGKVSSVAGTIVEKIFINESQIKRLSVTTYDLATVGGKLNPLTRYDIVEIVKGMESSQVSSDIDRMVDLMSSRHGPSYYVGCDIKESAVSYKGVDAVLYEISGTIDNGKVVKDMRIYMHDGDIMSISGNRGGMDIYLTIDAYVK